MVAMGLACVLVYPVLTAVRVSSITLRYPALVASGGGIKVVKRYRWLFQRFQPDVYYYGFLFLLRNSLIAAVPSVFPARPVDQILGMATVLVFFLACQMRLWPWRTDHANISDGCIGLVLVLSVVGGAVLAPQSSWFDLDAAEFAIAWYISVALLIALSCVASIMFYGVYRRLKPEVKFGAFLCHHKGGAGVLARYFKTELGKLSAQRVFLDSDQLEELDLIFDTVRAASSTLVLLGTREVLSRMWCAGEVTTAVLNTIPIVVVACTDFVEPDEAFLEGLERTWTHEQKHILASYGLQLSRIKDAYRYVRELSTLAFPRFRSRLEQLAVIEQVAVRCKLPRRMCSAKLPAAADAPADIMVVGNPEDPEALCACMVLGGMIQQRLVLGVVAILSAAELPLHLKSSSYAVVVLTKGLLWNGDFAEILLAVRAAAVELVTVHGDVAFDFPGPEILTRVRTEGMGRSIDATRGAELADAYQSVLQILALPLTPTGSISILDRQVEGICSRLRIESGSDRRSCRRSAQDASHEAVTPMAEAAGHQSNAVYLI